MTLCKNSAVMSYLLCLINVLCFVQNVLDCQQKFSLVFQFILNPYMSRF